jgi:hypothetical protein
MLSPRLSVTLFTQCFSVSRPGMGGIRGRVSFYFFWCINGRSKRLSRGQCVAALCSSYRLQKYIERWPAALNVAGLSALMKGSKIPRIELDTFHLYQHYSLSMHNKLQYTWCGDYCVCVWPAQLPVLTDVRAPSLLEQYPRYVPPPGPRRIQHNSCITDGHN